MTGIPASETLSPDLLRVVACGSIDDGKSTLIGRLLYEAGAVYDDQLRSLVQDTARFGTVDSDEMDFALLVDGLEAEREQGITIDVAHTFFTIAGRAFLLADVPGHEQYTRNMATGASLADIAIVLIDARKGILIQTRRHCHILALMGIRHIVLAINKMDLVGYDRLSFETICSDFTGFACQLGLTNITCIPVSARRGDNIAKRSERMPWYAGPALIPFLTTVDCKVALAACPLRFVTQWINRPHQDFRGLSGSVLSGSVRCGQTVTVLPSGRSGVLRRIVTMDGDREEAMAGQAVTLVLADEIDIARGDMIVDSRKPELSDRLTAHVLWLDDQPQVPGQSYAFQLGPLGGFARITAIHHKIDIGTLAHHPACRLSLNDVALCDFALDRRIPFDRYGENRSTGGFTLIDRFSNRTVGCGMIVSAVGEEAGEPSVVGKADRARIKGQKPCILLIMSSPEGGGTAVARLVESRLLARGCHTYLLETDAIPSEPGGNPSPAAANRTEHARHAGAIAKMFVEAGIIVIVSATPSPEEEWEPCRSLVEEGEFFEVRIGSYGQGVGGRLSGTPCRQDRDGEVSGLPGSPSCETPRAPEMEFDNSEFPPEILANLIIEALRKRQMF